MKIAFLDRDGTINRDYPDTDWQTVNEPEILPGAIDGMKYILSKGYSIIIITNQYTIGEGIITLEQYTSFSEKLLCILKANGISVLDTFYCPHARSSNCECCKPKPGMIRQALEKYPDIDLSDSFMCGDSVSDMLCSQNAGLQFYGINIGTPNINNLSDLCIYI